jgi:hypothetical protein
MKPELTDLAGEYKLNKAQQRELEVCLEFHSKAKEILPRKYSEKFQTYDSRYFANSLSMGIPPFIIFEMIRKEIIEFAK